MLRCRGTQFDPAVVDAFLIVMDTPSHADACAEGSGCGLPPWLGEEPFQLVLNPNPDDARPKPLTPGGR